MKKIAVLFLAISLLLVCSAQADTYEEQLDGAKMILDSDWKVDYDPKYNALVVYPFVKDGDIATKVIISKCEPVEWTLEMVEAEQQQVNDAMMETGQILISGKEITPHDYMLCNAHCIRFVSQYTYLDANSNERFMYDQAALFINKNYYMYFLAFSMDKLEQITEIVDTHFIWE